MIVAKPTFQTTDPVIEAVNAALILRRPLLVTGRPGSGKSTLIESVAAELRMGPVLRWNITSRSTVQDALYRYDAIGRLHAERLGQNDTEYENPRRQAITSIGDYLRLGPLGTAMLPARWPRALLIDEIDKSDIDLPNDLLTVFERGEFEIPELARMKTSKPLKVGDAQGSPAFISEGRIRCEQFPFVVLTSNGEREFPPAFLRRCIRIPMPDPDDTLLTKIVTAHLGSEAAAQAGDLIRKFAADSRETRALATDQLMNAIYVVTRNLPPTGAERANVVELILKQLVSDEP
ncbi:AAA family ATPase [Nocardia concava]|uniref:AAA family ATPase n=1 Tax=Nocardia concava TaxID=257281 RepID=UPI0002D43312|nr:MoxR family ATPase [Nocardia concava]